MKKSMKMKADSLSTLLLNVNASEILRNWGFLR